MIVCNRLKTRKEPTKMNETNYTPVSDGFHDAKIIFARRAEKHYGKEIQGHTVFELKLVATDTDIENPAAYRAEFPVVLIPGLPWDFYNEKLGKGEWRAATASDTKAAVEYAQRCFPAWKEYCDGLVDGSEEAAVSWFTNPELTKDAVVRAKFTAGGTYTGGDGFEHQDLKAKVYAPFEAKPTLTSDEAKAVSKALRAAGVKLFGSAKASAPIAPKKPEPPKPPKAEVRTVEKLMEDALAAYEEGFGKDDPQGAKYYARAAEIVGKPDYTWESWTAEEWKKIIEAFALPF